MDNKAMIIAALVIGAFYLSSSGEKEQRYMVPGTGYVPESQLPSYGYVLVNGKWYSQAQVDAAAAQAGVSSGNISTGSSAWNAIAAILAASIPLVTTIVNTTSGGNGGGGSSMGGIYGNSYRRTGTGMYRKGINNCSDDGFWTRMGDSNAARRLANCRWK